MAKRLWYVVKCVAGAFGTGGSCERIPGFSTKRKDAEKKMRLQPKDLRTIYWTDWVWKES